MAFPFLDTETADGFVTILLLQAAVISVPIGFASSFDSLFVIIVINMRMISQIMVGQVDELERMVACRSQYSRIEVKRRLVNIISMHCKYNE